MINLATGRTFLIINTQWVCLSQKGTEWWHFEVLRYREELKDRYGGVLSFNHYFLSLFEYYGNSLCRSWRCGFGRCCGATRRGAAGEAENDTYEAPGWVTSGDRHPALRLETAPGPPRSSAWLHPHCVPPIRLLRRPVGRRRARVPGSIAARGNDVGEPTQALSPLAKLNWGTTNLLAMIPWQAIVDFFRLSEKVEDDGVVPSEPVSTRSRWSLLLSLFPCYWSPCLLRLC